ncbi:MAG: AraC family transcriptional regulator [Rhodanobacter sp.]|nr:MAG: AraC family transcriptional regulator [Rhodanobacter sp.]TAM41807.1 MAG: AraC family transcriptional regulator [Rhodanobacter sp.]TAN23257.1 MAG: AraC family transcriptional regulator [Rhodanobacter sp.]
MATPIELPDHLAEHFQEVLAVHLIFMDRLTTITTRRHVVQPTTEFEANGSGHGAEPIPTNATKLDLTPVLHYVLEGQGAMSVHGGARLSLKQGNMVISPPGVRLWIEPDIVAERTVVAATSCHDLSQGWCHVRDGWGNNGVTVVCGLIRVTYQRATSLFEYLREPILEDFSGSLEINRIFATLLREMTEPQSGSSMIIESLLQQCLVMLLRRHCVTGQCRLPWLSALENPKLGKAIAAMLERPEACHTLKSLAQTAGMSRSAFAERFTTAFGCPAIAFLREIRLRRAARQLEATDLSVKVLAAASGFRSRSYFWRAFKEFYGVDPSHYRANRRTK